MQAEDPSNHLRSIHQINRPYNHNQPWVTHVSEQNGEAVAGLAALLAEGKLKYRESIVDGLDNAPRALIGLLKGENFGKQLVRIA